MSKLALITGGSRGLGAALCAHYQAHGYRVVEFSRSPAAPYSVQVDLNDPQRAAAVFNNALIPLAQQQFDEIVAINNAASVAPIGPVAHGDIAALIAHANVNYAAAIVFITQVVASFQSQACRKFVAHISSGAALTPIPGMAAYCAAKAGIEHFIRCVAAEQQQERHPFTLVNILPGVIDTDMQQQLRTVDPADFPVAGYFRQLHAAGNLREPAQVAAFIARTLAANPASGSRVDIDATG
jgi:NAD(P)-dependent dehydrogenase (short-subunit alcohol dehydrogenase family)